MELMKLKNCGSMVLSEAETCPKCGTLSLDKRSGRSSRKGLVAVIAIFVATIVCDGKMVYNPNDEEQMTIEITPELTEAVQKYDRLDDFHEGLAAVTKDNLSGFINRNGEEVIPCIYYMVEYFSEGLAAVWKDGFGFINKKGEEVVPCKYNYAGHFSEGLARVLKGEWWDGIYGFINKNGEEVIPCRYSNAGNFSEGLAVVEMEGKWGYVDKKGNSTFVDR